MPKESNQRKGTTPKNTAILLSHGLTTLVAMQNFVFTQGVDYPSHNNFRFINENLNHPKFLV
jgi:hypothetical protein